MRNRLAFEAGSTTSAFEKNRLAATQIAITGSLEGDLLFGTDAAESIDALDGSDMVFAGGGDDEVRGGGGTDILYGQNGADVLDGGDGYDTLAGGEGDDTLLGGAGTGLLYGEAGDDTLYGGDAADLLNGGGGSDRLHGAAGDDLVFSGDGDDMAWGDSGADTLYGENGADTLDGGDGDDILDGGVHDDRLYGGAGNDLITSGPGRDWVSGGAGADILFADDGDDYMNGDDDRDVLFGGAGNDLLAGGQGADELYGQAGTDDLHGDAGDDVLDGGPDADRLYGWDDADQLYGADGDDLLDGGNGADLVFGGLGDDTIDGGADDDDLFGEDGNDRIDGGSGADRVQGGAGDDVIAGGSGDDQVSGGDGADWIDGGSGGDQVYAGAGDDILDFALADDTGSRDLYDGGQGVDVLRLRLTDAQMTDSVLQAEISALAGLAGRSLDPASDAGVLFSFARLPLDVRNIEQIEVNGVARATDRAEVYIDPDAPDGGNGSLLNPFDSWFDVEWRAGTSYLQKAGTTFRESFSVSLQATEDARVVIGTYGGAHGERATINGSITFDGAAHVSLRGLHVTGAENGAVNLVNGAHHIEVVDNEISDSAIGVWITNGAGVANRIDANLIHNNASHGVAITLAGGAPGEETVVSRNSILSNGDHGIELHANHVIVERNEVAYNGSANIGTSGIHVFSATPDEDAARHNVIRNNVVFGTYENFGPDGNGIELDHWAKDTEVYGNVLYGNSGQGFVAFRASDFRFYGNFVFDNMQSEAHLNFARPTEVFLGSFSVDPIDQVHDYTVYGNVIASSGTFSGSGSANITALLVDAPTIFLTRNIGANHYFNADGGSFYLWGFSPDELWGPGEAGTDIETWNALKQNGDPDVAGGVNMLEGSAVDGDDRTDLIQGTDQDDTLSGGGGRDVLIGSDGNDRLDGGGDADVMVGGRGDDVYFVSERNDLVMEFPDSGADTVYSSGTYGLPSFVENAVLLGEEAVGLVGNELPNFLQGNESANGIQSGAGDDVVFGRGGDDFLIGGDGGDYLDGGAGNDVLEGGSGHDMLVGGAGEDVFVLRRGEQHGVILDFEGWYALYGDLLLLDGFGPDADLAYSGHDGVWQIHYALGGFEMIEQFTLVGVTLLSGVDYQFV